MTNLCAATKQFADPASDLYQIYAQRGHRLYRSFESGLHTSIVSQAQLQSDIQYYCPVLADPLGTG